VGNSIRRTEAGGSIVLRADLERDDALTIAVIDDGIGIDATDLPNIFDRFNRTDRVRSREIGGTGLRLAIARAIVEAHGGGNSCVKRWAWTGNHRGYSPSLGDLSAVLFRKTLPRTTKNRRTLMQPIQQEMAREFIARIDRDIRITERCGQAGLIMQMTDGQQLGIVRFSIARGSRRRFTINAYAVPGVPLPDPQSRFSNEQPNQPPRGWMCVIDTSDASVLSYVARVIENLYDMKLARSRGV